MVSAGVHIVVHMVVVLVVSPRTDRVPRWRTGGVYAAGIDFSGGSVADPILSSLTVVYHLTTVVYSLEHVIEASIMAKLVCKRSVEVAVGL